MVSDQNLEIQLQKLFQQKKYSEIVNEILSKTNEKDRSASLCNLLGISRITNNRNNKEIVSLALNDFKKGYLKEKTTIPALDSLANFIVTSILLRDLEKNNNFNFDEIMSYYKESEKLSLKHRAINIAMTMVNRRLNDPKAFAIHLDRVIKSKNFIAGDLISYGYLKSFDKSWEQSDFFNFGKFLNDNLKEYPKDNLVEISKNVSSKIKLGFFSSDIRSNHSITYFLKTILLNYDKNKFEIFLFINHPKEDQTTKNFENLVDKKVNVFKLGNIETLNKVRELKIDIMIDLMGYTSFQRIELFKNRMANKQITWLGYCNTTGIKNMDYIISDPNLIKLEEEKYYSEKVVYLPEIWNCHCGFDFERKEHPPPVINNNYFTFGSFNNFDKVNSEVIKVWSDILKNVKNSKLILKSGKDIHSTARMQKLFKKNGILESVKFFNREEKLEDHLNIYKNVDICLDTFPYNGVTTSFEATWMGVPVITMAGYNFNSRCGESINRNLNMESLIAKNPDEYIFKTIELTNNREKYLDIRKSIFQNALESPLFNAKKFSGNFYRSLEEILR
jgi:predicted O-linked N-acetylglucosamine transferase (SPINDLY family)